jgi:hypothetical protein
MSEWGNPIRGMPDYSTSEFIAGEWEPSEVKHLSS